MHKFAIENDPKALKMNFKPLRPRLKIGPYLQGKKGQNKPEKALLAKVAAFGPKKMALRVAKSKF